MHPSVQTTYNDLAQALTGLKASAPKPVREVIRQKRVMQLAWSMYRAKQAAELKDIELYRAEAAPEQFERWFKRNTSFNAKQFGFALQDAHRAIAIEERGPVFITTKQSLFIGSDSRWR
ncbi:hypothetical protein IR196_05080 [Brucella anthropi]|uniref:hypothetical protein n=1 Tax=Brucella anthropi TaxID=529 RepID=UPI00188DB2EF|nr:hypothetical protein [Brucella anthropi]MBM6397879.1 hypothetical protein [Brucella anthropi]QPA25471.1 hypothetical protein IR196_05080 [Brucella anthropi]